jgi:hypothetical protein
MQIIYFCLVLLSHIEAVGWLYCLHYGDCVENLVIVVYYFHTSYSCYTREQIITRNLLLKT